MMDLEKTLPAYTQLLTWVIRLEQTDLTANQKLILIQLCNFYSGKNVFVSVKLKKLAARTNLTKQTIIKTLKSLEKNKYIVIHQRYDEHGGRVSNRYELNFEKIMLEA